MYKDRDENGLTLEEFLRQYNVNDYERPSVTVDMAVFTLKEVGSRLELALLLIKRRNHPSMGMYALPGGFVEMNETISEAARRELIEETGVDGLIFRQFGTFGGLDRDPRTRVISVGHYAIAPYGSLVIHAGDDAAEAGLFTVKTRMLSRCASAEAYRIELSGACDITFDARLGYDVMGAAPIPKAMGALASDHDFVVFSALCALSNQPRLRVARLLTNNCGQVYAAVDALERALDRIPVCENISL